MNEKAVTDLKGQVRGDVIPPNDERYDAARRVYNAMIDKRPAVIVRCVDVADVISAVKSARAEGLAVAVRGGGHSVPGFGTADDAVVVDLARMKGTRVDPASKTVWAEGGCTWGDFNHANYAFGLATTGGIISTTGIGGLTLGGGIGYLTRGAGLSLDNLVSADVVLADGSFVTASEKNHPDLLWALRGGGGNFGVVTSFQYKLHPVKDIVGGVMLFEVGDAPKVMKAYNEYITHAPRELGAFFAWQIAPPLPFIPEKRHGDTFCAMVMCWTGPPDQAAKAFAPFRSAAPVVAEFVSPMPYPAMNSLFDGLVPPGLQHYWKAVFVRDLTDGAIDAHMKFGPKVPVVNSTMHIYPINGAVHDVAADATAFGHRDAKYATVIAGMWPDPKQNDANIRWVKDYYAALAPHSEKGGYINFAASDDSDRVAANFGRSFDQLRKLKAKYDPSNLFRINQNIMGT
ncbi:MAG TPA: FAD-binding oxidoreductase [Candidatus Acidoferrales bacterium]|nr:FAD-binding oxidoreductase [Candidatus Acidoferrales bacterium]